ncbi:unnamed protein product, partial [Brenthis ino]
MAIVVSYIQRNLVSKCNERWRNASRIKERFEIKNVNWLDDLFRVPLECRVTVNDPNTSGSSGGRPSKPYEAYSEKTKKRKNMELIQEYGLDCVLNAYAQEYQSLILYELHQKMIRKKILNTLLRTLKTLHLFERRKH